MSKIILPDSSFWIELFSHPGDSLILAHAQTSKALLLTFDYDFHGLPNVKVISKKK